LIDILVGSLHVYEDRFSYLLIESIIEKASKEEFSFRKEFVQQFLQRIDRLTISTNKYYNSTNQRLQITLLRWSIVLLKNAFDVLQEEKLLNMIISVQTSLLESISLAKPTALNSSFSKFRGQFLKVLYIFQIIIDFLFLSS
jgi:hypothetical protein